MRSRFTDPPLRRAMSLTPYWGQVRAAIRYRSALTEADELLAARRP